MGRWVYERRVLGKGDPSALTERPTIGWERDPNIPACKTRRELIFKVVRHHDPEFDTVSDELTLRNWRRFKANNYSYGSGRLTLDKTPFRPGTI